MVYNNNMLLFYYIDIIINNNNGVVAPQQQVKIMNRTMKRMSPLERVIDYGILDGADNGSHREDSLDAECETYHGGFRFRRFERRFEGYFRKSGCFRTS